MGGEGERGGRAKRLRRSNKREEEAEQGVSWRKTLPAGGMAIASNTSKGFIKI